MCRLRVRPRGGLDARRHDGPHALVVHEEARAREVQAREGRQARQQQRHQDLNEVGGIALRLLELGHLRVLMVHEIVQRFAVEAAVKDAAEVGLVAIVAVGVGLEADGGDGVDHDLAEGGAGDAHEHLEAVRCVLGFAEADLVLRGDVLARHLRARAVRGLTR